jgi:hypothetical protein
MRIYERYASGQTYGAVAAESRKHPVSEPATIVNKALTIPVASYGYALAIQIPHQLSERERTHHLAHCRFDAGLFRDGRAGISDPGPVNFRAADPRSNEVNLE